MNPHPNDNKYIRFFGGIQPVKGARVSLLYDLQRSTAYSVPNLLLDVLQEIDTRTIGEIKDLFTNQYDEGIDLFVDDLIDKELIFLTEEPSSFPPLDLDWDSPYAVACAVVEIDDLSAYNVPGALDQLDALGCASLQIRVLGDSVSWDEITDLIARYGRSRFSVIELIMPHQPSVGEEALVSFLGNNLRVTSVIFHHAPAETIHDATHPNLVDKVFFLQERLTYGQRDIVSPDGFIYNLPFFTEAQRYNVALNRKVSINHAGYLMNYPSHDKHYGHVDTTEIARLIRSGSFQEKWSIANDRIEKCKDCQFRYACLYNTDLAKRAGKWYMMDDCGYDPYTDSWNGTKG